MYILKPFTLSLIALVGAISIGSSSIAVINVLSSSQEEVLDSSSKILRSLPPKGKESSLETSKRQPRLPAKKSVNPKEEVECEVVPVSQERKNHSFNPTTGLFPLFDRLSDSELGCLMKTSREMRTHV